MVKIQIFTLCDLNQSKLSHLCQYYAAKKVLIRVRSMTIVKQTLITILGTIVVINSGFPVKASELTSEREAQLVHMVKQDCGSCHGMTLKGGLGPTLLPKAMNKLPLEAIKSTILHGRPGTAMPEWKSILTEQEAMWISQQLQQGIESHDQSK